MIRVLFVCLGNICRSPMAEAVFRHKVKEAGLENRIAADSAGTGDWHIGSAPHEGTRALLDRYRIGYEGMKARQVLAADLKEYDYVIAMDSKNKKDLEALAGTGRACSIPLFMDYVPGGEGTDVPDPYFTGNFDEVYKRIDNGCSRLLASIREKEGL
ncbi:low molecular weight phosphotyrosine protein phosphatase [Paenibacillus sp. CC-CFT747]|nr:low molecular weight phosphotyrosine protein phosphatase [Paenibacillus sp. CC-CFT747]